MEILGWSSVAMLRRYLGKIPVAQLKRYPTTLERFSVVRCSERGSDWTKERSSW
jgi:hypothetical protein